MKGKDSVCVVTQRKVPVRSCSEMSPLSPNVPGPPSQGLPVQLMSIAAAGQAFRPQQCHPFVQGKLVRAKVLGLQLVQSIHSLKGRAGLYAYADYQMDWDAGHRAAR